MKKLSALLLCIILVFAFCGCGSKNDSTKITVAASATPHAEILEQCKNILAKKGYELEIKVMDDYVIPNTATESGEVDANFFQHTPYLDDFNLENDTHLVSVLKVHYEPFGIYAGKCSSLDELSEGDKIAVPNDATNEGRALLLLAAQGLIILDDDQNLKATKANITENKLNLEIVEMEAALVPTVLDDVAVAVVNGNYAINAGLKVSDALATEDVASTAAQTYANVLVVKEGNENNEKTLALVEALKDESIAKFIEEKYDGAVVSVN